MKHLLDGSIQELRNVIADLIVHARRKVAFHSIEPGTESPKEACDA